MLMLGSIARAAILAAGALTAAPGLAQTPPAQVAETSKGKALVDPKGMTLYIFDRDSAGKSNCTGQCAQNWPPFAASANAQAASDWSVITRDDGSRQWAYKGKPLYTWTKDTRPGDATGDGVNNVWHIARP
jgi:predicted lipoprotein with Yx(FWY)xxD motif